MENVKPAPLPRIDGYVIWNLVLNNRHIGGVQNRVRRFSFGTPTGVPLTIEYAALETAEYAPCVTANGIQWDSRRRRIGLEDTRPCSRSDRSLQMYRHYARWQGMPEDFLAEAPFTVAGKVKILGNGVPMTMGRAIAQAVRRAMESSTPAMPSHPPV